MRFRKEEGVDLIDFTRLQKQGILKKVADKDREANSNIDIVDLRPKASSQTNSDEGISALSFLSNLASASNENSASSQASGFDRGLEEKKKRLAEFSNMKVSIENLEYKMDRFLERIEQIEFKIIEFEKKVELK